MSTAGTKLQFQFTMAAFALPAIAKAAAPVTKCFASLFFRLGFSSEAILLSDEESERITCEPKLLKYCPRVVDCFFIDLFFIVDLFSNS
jgi:hypothetical protein